MPGRHSHLRGSVAIVPEWMMVRRSPDVSSLPRISFGLAGPVGRYFGPALTRAFSCATGMSSSTMARAPVPQPASNVSIRGLTFGATPRSGPLLAVVSRPCGGRAPRSANSNAVGPSGPMVNAAARSKALYRLSILLPTGRQNQLPHGYTSSPAAYRELMPPDLTCVSLLPISWQNL